MTKRAIHICGGRARRCPACRSRDTTSTGNWAWCGSCGACFDARTNKQIAADRETTDRWVKRLNAAGRELDAKARSMHPSARGAALASERAAYRRIARRAP